MSNKATTRWKEILYARALKHEPKTHSSVMFEGKLLCIVALLPCHYCGKKLRREQATVDHVIPKSKGGSNNSSNFVLSCAPCNTSKGSGEAPGAPHVSPKPPAYEEKFKAACLQTTSLSKARNRTR